MGFNKTKRTLGMKIESTPYTAETLAATDYNIEAFNIEYTPEIAVLERKIARGDLSRDVSITGKRQVTITFSIHAYTSSTLNSPPNYFKCLQACGMFQTIHGSTGVSLVPHASYTNVPATIEVVEKDEGTSPSQVVIKAHGCMGNVKIPLGNVGEPLRYDFEYKGVLTSITDRAYGSILTPTGMTSQQPEAVLACGITLFGEGQQLNTITIDLGNVVENYTDPTKDQGYEGARVVDRNPNIALDPDLELIATQGDYARWTGNTTGIFSMQIGDNMAISAPAAQLTNAYQPGEREGHVVNNKTLELKRSSGNDELKILQGSES